MRAILFLLLCALIFISQISSAQEEQVLSYEIDQQATVQASWSAGETIYTSKDDNYYRKFLGVTIQGNYLVQDFYSVVDTKYSDPFIVTNVQGTIDFHDRSFVEGKFVIWRENGTRIREGQYQDGQQQGLWTAWYENGQKREEGHYFDNKKVGLWTEWYENGQKREEGHYFDNKKVGLWTEWYENGQKNYEGNYQIFYTGPFMSKPDNSIVYYSFSLTYGPSTIWYANGQKRQESYYQLDLTNVNKPTSSISGLSTTWYENGQKRSEGVYHNSKKTGFWTEWSENGQEIEEGTYDFSFREGIWTCKSRQGMQLGLYHHGHRNGTWIYWNQNGRKIEEILYDNGNEIHRRAY